MAHLRVITPAEFERARLAFVAGWEARNDQLGSLARERHTGRLATGERSSAGLTAALDSLGIIVATDEALRTIARAAADAPRILGGSNA